MAEEIILEINSLVVGVNAHDKRVYSTIFMLPQIFFFAKVCGIFWPDNCQKGVSEALNSE